MSNRNNRPTQNVNYNQISSEGAEVKEKAKALPLAIVISPDGEVRSEIKAKLQIQGYDVVKPVQLDADPDVRYPIFHQLSLMLEGMSLCKAVMFADAWHSDPVCKMLHDIAQTVGITVFYEMQRVINCTSLNVREQPDDVASIITSLPVNYRVRVVDTVPPHWALVEYKDPETKEAGKGYMHIDYLIPG